MLQTPVRTESAVSSSPIARPRDLWHGDSSQTPSRRIHSDTDSESDSEGVTSTVVSSGPRHLHRATTVPATSMSSGSLTSVSATIRANKTSRDRAIIYLHDFNTFIGTTDISTLSVNSEQFDNDLNTSLTTRNINTELQLFPHRLRPPKPVSLPLSVLLRACATSLDIFVYPFSAPYIWIKILPPRAQTLVLLPLEQSDDT